METRALHLRDCILIMLLLRAGTGKTLLAKAVAGEAGVPFFYRCGIASEWTNGPQFAANFFGCMTACAVSLA